MNEAELASLLVARVVEMSPESRAALVDSIFDAFRDRGESSEDAAEGSGTALNHIENGDVQAVAALISYARENTGVLKEALCGFVEHHSAHIDALPASLVDGILGRLAQP